MQMNNLIYLFTLIIITGLLISYFKGSHSSLFTLRPHSSGDGEERRWGRVRKGMRRKNYFTIFFILLINYKLPMVIISYSLNYPYLSFLTIFITCPLFIIIDQLYKNSLPSKKDILRSLVIAIILSVLLRAFYWFIDPTILLETFEILFIPLYCEMVLHPDGLIQWGYNPNKNITTFFSDRNTTNGNNYGNGNPVNGNNYGNGNPVNGNNYGNGNAVDGNNYGNDQNNNINDEGDVQNIDRDNDHDQVINRYILRAFNSHVSNDGSAPYHPYINGAYRSYLRNNTPPRITHWIRNVNTAEEALKLLEDRVDQFLTDVNNNTYNAEQRWREENSIVRELSDVLDTADQARTSMTLPYSRGLFTNSAITSQLTWPSRLHGLGLDLTRPGVLSRQNAIAITTGRHGPPDRWGLERTYVDRGTQTDEIRTDLPGSNNRT